MITALLFLPLSFAQIEADPVVYSFAFFGCNRVDKEAWDPKANPSSANLPQLRRTLQDIADLKPRPNALFATGDLVMGYGDDHGEEVRQQLDAWIDEFRHSQLEGKIELVAMPGNHEMNRKVGKDKLPSPYTTGLWNDWVTKNKLMPVEPNGPKEGVDNMADDQSLLNYSFDRGALHFTVLNTDSRCTNGKIAWIPTQWAIEDVKKATTAGKTCFMFGHRNLWEPITSKGDSPIDPEAAKPLQDALLATPQFCAYICAHVHAWDLRRIGETGPWQIVGGNGGSTLETDWKTVDGRLTFGFGVVSLHKSGKLVLTPYLRPAKDDPNPPAAKPEPEVLLGHAWVK